MAAHARLKNEFTEEEKYHNFMSWLICNYVHDITQTRSFFSSLEFVKAPLSFIYNTTSNKELWIKCRRSNLGQIRKVYISLDRSNPAP